MRVTPDSPLIECPLRRGSAPCPVRGTAPAIEAHIVEQHLVSPSEAKRLMQDPPKVLQQTQKVLRSPTEEEIPMARKTADPSACQLCARLTTKYEKPMKCKRHGGPGLSTSNHGKGPKKDQSPKARIKAAGLDATLATRLTAAKAKVTQLRADLALEELRVQIYSELVGA